MHRAWLNIGHNVPGGKLDHGTICGAVARRLCWLEAKVIPGIREDTSVFVVACPPPHMPQLVGEVYLLAIECQQDCIAIRFEDGSGMLVGPHAGHWGQFDPASFKGV